MTLTTDAPPRTERGTGLSLPIAKALADLMVVIEAWHRDWPLSNRDAASQLDAAIEHYDDLRLPDTILSSTFLTEITDWVRDTRTLIAAARTELFMNEDLDAKTLLPDLRDAVERTWALLTALDHELTGMSPTLTDRGRTP